MFRNPVTPKEFVERYNPGVKWTPREIYNWHWAPAEVRILTFEELTKGQPTGLSNKMQVAYDFLESMPLPMQVEYDFLESMPLPLRRRPATTVEHPQNYKAAWELMDDKSRFLALARLHEAAGPEHIREAGQWLNEIAQNKQATSLSPALADSLKRAAGDFPVELIGEKAVWHDYSVADPLTPETLREQIRAWKSGDVAAQEYSPHGEKSASQFAADLSGHLPGSQGAPSSQGRFELFFNKIIAFLKDLFSIGTTTHPDTDSAHGHMPQTEGSWPRAHPKAQGPDSHHSGAPGSEDLFHKSIAGHIRDAFSIGKTSIPAERSATWYLAQMPTEHARPETAPLSPADSHHSLHMMH